MIFSKELESSVLNKTFSLLIKEFTAYKTNGVFFISGHGRLYLNSHGIIVFDYILTDENESPGKKYSPGQLVDEDDTCVIHMEDERGNHWYSMNVFIRQRDELRRIFGSISGSVQLYKIESNYRRTIKGVDGGKVFFASHRKVEMPSNIVTEVRTSERPAGSKKKNWKFSRISLDKADVISRKYTIRFSWHDDFLQASYKLKARNERFHERIRESLMYFTGSMPRVALCVQSFSFFEFVSIHSHRCPPIKSQRAPLALWPPIQKVDPYKLFSKYLDYAIRNSDETGWSDIGRELASIVYSRDISTSMEILTTCVAIEWMTKAHFGHIRVSRVPKKSMHSLIKGIKALRVSADLKRRAVDVLQGTFSQVRCKDVLRILGSRGVISDKMRSAWDRNRNISAHGGKDHVISQKSVDDSDALYQLLSHLVFWTIGYRGPYSDYATPGWPTSRNHHRVNELGPEQPH